MSNFVFNWIVGEGERRRLAEILEERQFEENHQTETTKDQNSIETDVLELFMSANQPVLYRQKHVGALKKLLTEVLSKDFESLDCSRPWLCYWILHSLEILGERLEDKVYSNVIDFLAKCQSPDGGFGGGPGQYPHLASTYAAVNALCTIGSIEAYKVINRERLYHFLLSLHGEDGSFIMHADGETDLRGIYCALAVAKITNVYTPTLFEKSEDYVARCQTWEGGFGGCPGMEAHGGYAFCGLAVLVLLGQTHLFCLSSFLRWLVNKQMRLEGGFQGRTNKLVDGCYSFWQGGSFPLIHAILTRQDKICNIQHWMFNQEALQEYLLICCQYPQGGLLDKPKRKSDAYHTCYGLSGLSVAQNSPKPIVIGSPNINLVKNVNPVFNLVQSSAVDALHYFETLPLCNLKD
ncbi:protein farnesyltransferase subunit beta [Prorops nasuta]|uniref:protein farnesyltransferase subunit beta n=1 Tax=Prorops nasuta TaxID=863751 RepID=UPI0034CD75FA